MSNIDNFWAIVTVVGMILAITVLQGVTMITGIGYTVWDIIEFAYLGRDIPINFSIDWYPIGLYIKNMIYPMVIVGPLLMLAAGTTAYILEG